MINRNNKETIAQAAKYYRNKNTRIKSRWELKTKKSGIFILKTESPKIRLNIKKQSVKPENILTIVGRNKEEATSN